jgi:hypothetical protein
VRALIGLLNVADSSTARGPILPVGLASHQGTCMTLGAQNPTSVPSRFSAIAIIAIQGANASGGGGGAGRGLVSSLQLVEADGSVRLVVSPFFAQNVPVPPANLP